MNERIKHLVRQAADDNNPSHNEHGVFLVGKELEQFARLIVQGLVSKMEVDGSDFYYNQFNDYGAVTVKFFVDCDPKEKMVGAEVQADYPDGRRGTGRYHLNDRFVDYLLEQLDGI